MKMVTEPKMVMELSEKIKSKIDNSKFPNEVKGFLQNVVLLEFEHLDEAKPHVLDEYESLIKKYAKKWEEK